MKTFFRCLSMYFLIPLFSILPSLIFGQTPEETLEWLNINGKKFVSFKSEKIWYNDSGRKRETIMYGGINKISSDSLTYWSGISRYRYNEDNDVAIVNEYEFENNISLKDIWVEGIDDVLFYDNFDDDRSYIMARLSPEERKLFSPHFLLKIRNPTSLNILEEYECWSCDDDSKNHKKEKQETAQTLIILCDDTEKCKRTIKAIMHLAKLAGAKENIQRF